MLRGLPGTLGPVKQNLLSLLQLLYHQRPSTGEIGIHPPRIPTSTQHYDYALLIIVGVKSQEAVKQIGVSPRTAECWRRELCAVAERYFGRDVTYEFAARYALDEEWARLVDAPAARERACDGINAAIQSRFATSRGNPQAH